VAPPLAQSSPLGKEEQGRRESERRETFKKRWEEAARRGSDGEVGEEQKEGTGGAARCFLGWEWETHQSPRFGIPNRTGKAAGTRGVAAWPTTAHMRPRSRIRIAGGFLPSFAVFRLQDSRWMHPEERFSLPGAVERHEGTRQAETLNLNTILRKFGDLPSEKIW